jgi:flagellar biosynthesis/type III secretory pathway M-ring protein FliF/YscJ
LTPEAIASEMMNVKIAVALVLVAGMVVIAIHNYLIRQAERKAKDHELRIVKMENWPNHEDRLKTLEAHCEHLEREMNALRSSPFTGATLKQVQ